jgi:phosphatidylglycerophosphate synthase
MASNRASDAVRRFAGDLALGLVPIGVVAAATWRLLGLPATYLAIAAALYTGMVLLLLTGAARASASSGAGMGAANRVTLIRATFALPVGTGVGSINLASLAAWWVILLSTIAMVLDGVDGRVARRTGTGSALGGRFDMELDAFFLFALSALVWQSGRAGAWVLLIGALRYVFVAAGWLTERLRGELPDSFRRKTACVISGIALLVSLGPIIPPGLAALAAAVGLVSLVYSFVVDVGWLLGRPASREPAEGH